MKRVKEITIGDAIDTWLKGMNKHTQVHKARIANQWADYVGVMAANHSTKVLFDGNVLLVCLDSAVVRRELELIKTPLIERINQEVGSPLVSDIRFSS